MLNRFGLACALLLAGQHCAGTILYSNFSSTYPFPSPGGNTYAGNYFGTAFTTTAGGLLGTVTLGLSDNEEVPVTGQVAGLYTDSGGEPGTLLESWTVSVPLDPGGLVTLTSTTNPAILSGTTYFLVFTNEAYSVEWYENDTSVLGGIWIGSTLTGLSEDLTSSPALGIELTSVSSVPEPATGTLVAAGVLALGILRFAFPRGRAVSDGLSVLISAERAAGCCPRLG
jgi:hypothetical protein